MKYMNGRMLRSVVCAAVVLSGTFAAIAPQAVSAATAGRQNPESCVTSGVNSCTKTTGSVSCTVGSFGTFTLVLKTKATYVNTIAHGSSESAKAVAKVTIPSSLNTLEWAAGYRSYKGSVSQALIDNNDATPSPYNAASNNTITIAPTNLPNGGSTSSTLKFTITNTGPFTFTSAGTDKVVAGDSGSNSFATATVDLYKKANEGGTATPITATCTTPYIGSVGTPFVLATITVT